MKNYFYDLLCKYLTLHIFNKDKVVAIEPVNSKILNKISQSKVAFRSQETISFSKDRQIQFDNIQGYRPDYILLNGVIQFDDNIHDLFRSVRKQCSHNTRIVITFYNSLWRPLIWLMTKLGFRDNLPESNWISPDDVHNFLLLNDFDIVQSQSRILFPLKIPFVSNFINKYLAPLPIVNLLNIINIVVARPVFKSFPVQDPSVSVVVAARNEEGNIEDIIARLPKMGPDDELIIVEGNSTDNTWEKLKSVHSQYKDKMNFHIAQQDGKGKGDAVRKGFDLASKDILMILDADLTVPPEELPKFYEAIKSGKGEYINGSRLVYPMEEDAMRFANIIGNKFFAMSFSFVLGQRFKDTLCGTKVISRENYLQLAKHRFYFGDFDPFGDFDLIFGSARMCLKILEIPIKYRKRTYGDTNISRWKHGVILLKMLVFASRKIKFI